MTSRISRFTAAAGVALGGALAGCGAGTPVTPAQLPERIEVRVSAGAPIAGAVVTVYAISDVTGLPDTTAGAGGVLGSAGPTDAAGQVTVTLASRGHSGPVQVVAAGPSLVYPDPTAGTEGGVAAPLIQIPATFSLSSYVPRLASATGPVPVTLLTTLADRAALAWARGRHPAQRDPTTLTAALAARDGLFVAHVTADTAAWSPSALRTTVPAHLGAGPQTLVGPAYAALVDVALNQLARDVAARAGYGPSSNAITAVTLAQLLQDDLDADGRFDGRGVGGLLLATPGNPPVALDEQTLRVPLAIALDAWIRNPAANRSGIGQADLVSAKVYDALTTDDSNLFGGPPAAGVFDPVDRTPPVLVFATAPPRFTNQPTLALAIDATDATGVGAVFAESGGRQFAGTNVAGTWQVPVELVPGHNAIDVWADDTASPTPNSGVAATEPHRFRVEVLLDQSPPTAIYDATFASYVPERELGVATHADGSPILPAGPNIAGRVKRAITLGGDIVKMATTIAAGRAFDATELEADNTLNVPVLRFAVPLDPAFDSPIVRATYTAQVSCAGCAYPERAGAMLASPHAVQGFVFFDLPIAAETIPDLAALPGTATIQAKLFLADAAGNSASAIDAGTYTFHAVGPSLLVMEDAAYPQAGDPKSTFPYARTAPSYSTLYDSAATAFLPERQVRLARYVVANPWSVPVLADVSLEGAAWTASETWRGEVLALPALAYNADGMSFSGSTDWAATCDGIPTFPCGGAVADQNTKYPIHLAGSPTQYLCETKPAVPGSTSTRTLAPPPIVAALQGAAAAGLHAFLPGGPWDTIAASRIGGRVLVPAATSTEPGRVNLYVTRPVAETVGRTVPLSYGRLNPNSPSSRFETWEWDHWMDAGTAPVSCTFRTFRILLSCSICGTSPIGQCLPCAVPLVLTNSYRLWFAHRHVRYLEAASDNLIGTLTVSSLGLTADGIRGFGEPAVQASRIDLQRTIAH